MPLEGRPVLGGASAVRLRTSVLAIRLAASQVGPYRQCLAAIGKAPRYFSLGSSFRPRRVRYAAASRRLWLRRHTCSSILSRASREP